MRRRVGEGLQPVSGGLRRRQCFRVRVCAVQARHHSARGRDRVFGGLRRLADEGLLAAFVDLVADVDEAALRRLEALVEARRKGKR